MRRSALRVTAIHCGTLRRASARTSEFIRDACSADGQTGVQNGRAAPSPQRMTTSRAATRRPRGKLSRGEVGEYGLDFGISIVSQEGARGVPELSQSTTSDPGEVPAPMVPVGVGGEVE